MSKQRERLQEVCVVACRPTLVGTEFCLLISAVDRRWEFPKASLDQEDGMELGSQLKRAAIKAGLRGRIVLSSPLGEFDSSRGNLARRLTGYLMHVDDSCGQAPEEEGFRRLWCLAEEARIRLRRKPLRRMIDLALHELHAAPQILVNGNGCVDVLNLV